MSAIKLPVRAVYPWDRLEFLDADGQPVAPEDIAAALNAAPKLAFEGLTVEALGEMLSETGEEMGDPPHDLFARTSWLVAHDTALLSRLQAFAALQAPQWMPITVEAVQGRGYLLLRPDPLVTACHEPKVAALISSEMVSGEFEWEEEGGTTYSFHCFSHYLPLNALPAAPERALIDQPAPAPFGSYLGSDDSDCGNG